MPKDIIRNCKSYLDDLAKLSQENLNKNDYDLPIHDHQLPMVSLWDAVSIVQETKFSLGLRSIELLAPLIQQNEGQCWYAQAP